MRGLSDIPSAGVRHVRVASRAGREPDVAVELSRRRSTLSNAAAPDLHLLCSHVQVDLPGGAVRRHRGRRDDAGRWGGSASGQSAVVVSEDQSYAVVDVTAVAAVAQEREYGQTGQLQAETDPTAGHYYSGCVRAAGRRVGSPRDRPRQAERARRIVAGHRRGRHSRPHRLGISMRQICYSEEAPKRAEQALMLRAPKNRPRRAKRRPQTTVRFAMPRNPFVRSRIFN